MFGREGVPNEGMEALPHPLPCAARRSGYFELRVYLSTINQDSSKGKKKERKKKDWEKNTSYFQSALQRTPLPPTEGNHAGEG